jgi:hypothetical protein
MQLKAPARNWGHGEGTTSTAESSLPTILIQMNFMALKRCVLIAFFSLLSGCVGLPVPPHDYNPQLVVPVCLLSCVTESDESVQMAIWGQNEEGKLRCHGRPSSFSGTDAFTACKETLRSHCEFALSQFSQENPNLKCTFNESVSWRRSIKSCMIVYEHWLDDWPSFSTYLPPRPPKSAPQCEQVIMH